MNARFHIIVSACVVALMLSVASLLWSTRRPDPASAAAPMHGTFGSRLQPKLEGIGSTQDLPAVRLQGAEQGSPVDPPKDMRHEPAGHSH